MRIKQYLYLLRVQMNFSRLLMLQLLGTLLPTCCQQSRSEPARECRRWAVASAAAALIRLAAWILLVNSRQIVVIVLPDVFFAAP